MTVINQYMFAVSWMLFRPYVTLINSLSSQKIKGCQFVGLLCCPVSSQKVLQLLLRHRINIFDRGLFTLSCCLFAVFN